MIDMMQESSRNTMNKELHGIFNYVAIGHLWDTYVYGPEFTRKLVLDS